jgi:hypothetical protein
LNALEGVGSRLFGEYENWTGKAYHVRRRLSVEEEAIIGPAVDVRGTREALCRVEMLLAKSPFLDRKAVFEEAGLEVIPLP